MNELITADLARQEVAERRSHAEQFRLSRLALHALKADRS